MRLKMLKFDLYSDIHLDHWDSYGYELDEFIPPQKSENLIIAGDIATNLSDRNKKVSELFSILSEKYDKIFIVLGNHDYWGGDLLTESFFTQERYPHITVLNNSSVVIPEYNLRILGATMWSNINPPLYNYIANRMNDYNYIKCNNSRVTVQNTVDEHQKTVKYITDTIENEANPNVKQYLIVTHHAPSFLSADPMYTDNLTEAYCNNLDNFIYEHPKIRYWVHGHIHSPSEYQINQTTILCNPIGYPRRHVNKIDPYQLVINT